MCTSFENSCKIITVGCIKRSQLSYYNYAPDIFKTDKEYVYLTNNIAKAISYGRNTASAHSDKRVIIFSIEINKTDLLADEDELGVIKQMNQMYVVKENGDLF